MKSQNTPKTFHAPSLIQTMRLTSSPLPKQRIFKLPGIDSILDLCRNREDFPRHLINNNGKRRRSLVREFLLSDYEMGVTKRFRANSIDPNPNYQVYSWHDSSNQQPGLKNKRRHSMLDGRELQAFQLKASYTKGAIRPWTIEEDGKLLSAVKTFGNQWSKVAAVIPDRNRRQCKEHWIRVLSKRPCAKEINLETGGETAEIDVKQDIKDAELSRRGLWSEDEDAKLIKAYQDFGPRWPLIATRVLGRNQRQCEKRFRRIKKSMESLNSPVQIARQNTDPISQSQSAETDEGLMDLAAVACAQGFRTPLSCS